METTEEFVDLDHADELGVPCRLLRVDWERVGEIAEGLGFVMPLERDNDRFLPKFGNVRGIPFFLEAWLTPVSALISSNSGRLSAVSKKGLLNPSPVASNVESPSDCVATISKSPGNSSGNT